MVETSSPKTVHAHDAAPKAKVLGKVRVEGDDSIGRSYSQLKNGGTSIEVTNPSPLGPMTSLHFSPLRLASGTNDGSFGPRRFLSTIRSFTH